MGHFSYTCQLSGIPITDGDKAVLLPIFPKEHCGYDNSQKSMLKYGKSNLCSNDGPNLYFDELTFPIFGEYDSYGRIEKIEKDDNTKVLEEFFQLTIEQIATVLTDGRKDEYDRGGEYCDSVKILNKDNKKHMMLLKTSTTWFRREVYDNLTKIDTKEYFDKLDLGTHGILAELGFSFSGIDKSKERYNKVYIKDSLEIFSDGTWINIPKEFIYDLTSLKDYCNRNNVEIDITKIKGGRYSQLYDYVLPYCNSLSDFTSDRHLIDMLLGDEYKVSANRFLIYNEFLKEGIKTQSEIDVLQNELIKDNLTLFYFSQIKKNGEEFLKKNIIEWFTVKSYYYPTGRFLFPIGTSDQDGNHHKVKLLLEASLSVINEDISKRTEDEDEDED